jgi:hypothetical protein
MAQDVPDAKAGGKYETQWYRSLAAISDELIKQFC